MGVKYVGRDPKIAIAAAAMAASDNAKAKVSLELPVKVVFIERVKEGEGPAKTWAAANLPFMPEKDMVFRFQPEGPEYQIVSIVFSLDPDCVIAEVRAHPHKVEMKWVAL